MNDARTRGVQDGEGFLNGSTRRDFLRMAGLGSVALLLPTILAACNEDPIVPEQRAPLDLSTDTGILNFAFLISQFQYEIYRQLMFRPFITSSLLEAGNPTSSAFGRMQSHWLNTNSVLKNTIGSGQITGSIEFNFRSVDFSSRSSVFAIAKAGEDNALATFNGLLPYCKNADTLVFLSKIASVTARRSATIRDLEDIAAGQANTALRTSFASDAVVSATGLERVMSPAEYVAFAQPYTVATISIRGA